MRERKVVKLRIDMYEDTKFKIIDMKPERDLIHYVWTRLLTLAGKVNLEGDLYMSKNLQYTIETLAIEFNRAAEQIKLAIDVFIELEMIELTEGNVYRVRNFAKHQNIKVKEKIKSIDEAEVVKIDDIGNLGITSSSIDKVDNRGKGKINNNEKDNIPIISETKKNKTINNKKKKEKIFNINEVEDAENEDIVSFCDGERPLGKGEKVIASWVV